MLATGHVGQRLVEPGPRGHRHAGAHQQTQRRMPYGVDEFGVAHRARDTAESGPVGGVAILRIRCHPDRRVQCDGQCAQLRAGIVARYLIARESTILPVAPGRGDHLGDPGQPDAIVELASGGSG